MKVLRKIEAPRKYLLSYHAVRTMRIAKSKLQLATDPQPLKHRMIVTTTRTSAVNGFHTRYTFLEAIRESLVAGCFQSFLGTRAADLA